MWIIRETFNRITNLLVVLIVTLFILPASTFMYASGSPQNSDNSGGGSSDGSGSTNSDNETASSGGFPDNNAASPIVSTESDNSGNAQGVDSNSILSVHNQERAEFEVTPLTWSNTLAADAQTWADHLVTLQIIDGSNAHDLNPNSNAGENIGVRGHNVMNPAPPDQMQQIWLREKSNYDGTFQPGSGNYGQMVSPVTTEAGCAAASTLGGPFAQSGGTDILVCRYTPRA